MDNFEGGYYKINRILLSSIGLWPYGISRPVRIQRICIIFNFVISAVLQSIKLFEMGSNMNYLLKGLSYNLPNIIILLKYITYCFGEKTVKKLLERIKYDWSILQDDTEVLMMQKSAYIGRLYTLFFMLTLYCLTSTFGVLQFSPIILDIVVPLNECRTREILVPIELFINQEDYFYMTATFVAVFTCLGTTTIIATTTIYTICVQHACGMFRLASYRLKCAIEQASKMANAFERSIEIFSSLNSAIEVHNRAIEFCEFLRSTFVLSYLALVCLGVLSLTVHLFCIFQTISNMQSKIDLMTGIAFVSMDICYMFFGNYLGQKIMNHSIDFFHQTYNSVWYDAPLNAQKQLLFVMQRSTKETTLLFGGIFVPSLEGFATIVSTSISYFTVLCSI